MRLHPALYGDYVNRVISEHPYVKLLQQPYAGRNNSGKPCWCALAQVNSSLAIVEVKITRKGSN